MAWRKASASHFSRNTASSCMKMSYIANENTSDMGKYHTTFKNWIFCKYWWYKIEGPSNRGQDCKWHSMHSLIYMLWKNKNISMPYVRYDLCILLSICYEKIKIYDIYVPMRNLLWALSEIDATTMKNQSTRYCMYIHSIIQICS